MLSPEDTKKFNTLIETAKKQTKIDWDKISIPDNFESYQNIGLAEGCLSKTKDMLNKIAVVKLNGGLGSTMGCSGPKSILKVKGRESFLSLIVRQIKYLNDTHNVDIPLCLMNSKNTADSTKDELDSMTDHITIHNFMQSTYPRLRPDTFEPLTTEELTDSTMKYYYPPGHGDVYFALRKSGILPKLKERGIEYLFISNVDNLGATIDLKILNHILNRKFDFLMEVTKKTLLDVKGGTIVGYGEEQKLMLLEAAQVEEKHMEEFKSIDKFKVFNTNNLWLSIDALLNTKSINLPVIFNRKKIDLHGDVATDVVTEVLQLETAMGAAVRSFDYSRVIVVPRTRFIPVKKTSDLFLLRSNLFNINKITGLVAHLYPNKQLPILRFSEKEFSSVHEFNKRFSNEIPDIKELESLELKGTMMISGDCVLIGDVKIENKINLTITLVDRVFSNGQWVFS